MPLSPRKIHKATSQLKATGAWFTQYLNQLMLYFIWDHRVITSKKTKSTSYETQVYKDATKTLNNSATRQLSWDNQTLFSLKFFSPGISQRPVQYSFTMN